MALHKLRMNDARQGRDDVLGRLCVVQSYAVSLCGGGGGGSIG